MIEKTQGLKIYILCLIGALYVMAGWMFGPVDIGQLQIPAYTFNDMYTELYKLGILAGARSAAKKLGNGNGGK